METNYRTRIAFSTLAVLLQCRVTALASGSEVELWPRLDMYWDHSGQVRTMLRLGYYDDRDVEGTKADIGFSVDYFARFKPIVFRRLSVQDRARVKRLTLSGGYRYLPAADDTKLRVEQRLYSDATLRLALAGDVLLSNRNRAESRWLDGGYSWRYRNQVKLERDHAFGLLGRIVLRLTLQRRKHIPVYGRNFGGY